jgi:ATP-binding cassette subfamily B protein
VLPFRLRLFRAPADPGPGAIGGLDRWRSLLRLLWAAGRGRTVLLGVLVLATGLLPTAVIVLTGALVRAVPAAAAGGDARPATLALAGLVACMAVLTLGGSALAQLARELDAAFALEVHHRAALATLGPPGLAPLEDPAFADHLHAIQDAERRGVLRRTVQALAIVLATRLRGAGAFAVLLGFGWWAPLALAAAWHLTNRLYLQATSNGLSVNMGDGAVRLRRAEYLRSLAVDSPAAKEVRVFGLGGWIVGRYTDAWLRALRVMWRSRRANRGLAAAAALALLGAHAAVMGALAWAAARGELSAAAILVYAQAAIATSDLGMIGDWQWFLAQSMAVAHRADALEGDPLPPPAADAGGGGGAVAVRLDGVRFAYRGRERPTLDGLTLHVPAGQSIAVVGENGAGKSTLIKLLCGFYEPDAGTVALDGVAPPGGRGRIGVIFQEFVRYRLPLRENVAFGHLGSMGDDAVLEGALRDAGGGALLDRLPRGWDTVLSKEFEGGAELSGGQWQRVALARALAAVRGGAGLLILDEPTAALDVRAETELFDRFLALTRGVTTILVSHRLSSVRHADRIVVIDGGRVAEDGTHAQLMAAGGIYARMFSLQAERFAAVPADGGGEEEADA